MSNAACVCDVSRSLPFLQSFDEQGKWSLSRGDLSLLLLLLFLDAQSFHAPGYKCVTVRVVDAQPQIRLCVISECMQCNECSVVSICDDSRAVFLSSLI